MDCQQLHEQIESLTLRTSDVALDKDAMQHLEDCLTCREEFREYQEAWLLPVAALSPSTVSQELEDRVMQRVMNAPTSVRAYAPRTVFWKYALAASVLFLLVSGTIFRLGLVGKDQPSITDADINQMRLIAEQVAKLSELERVFAAPELRYVSLRTGPTEPLCYLIHDPMSEQIHFLGKRLQAVDGSKLWLWLLSKGGRVLAAAPINQTTKAGSVGALIKEPRDGEFSFAVISRELADRVPESPSDEVVFRREVELNE